VRQLTDRHAHAPTTSELRRAERESWFRVPDYDYKPSSRLAIDVTDGRPYRQSSWSDGDTALEAWPQVLQEIELRAGFAEEQRLEQQRREAEKRRQWELAMSKARSCRSSSNRSVA